jgi:hypothetical protein
VDRCSWKRGDAARPVQEPILRNRVRCGLQKVSERSGEWQARVRLYHRRLKRRHVQALPYLTLQNQAPIAYD